MYYIGLLSLFNRYCKYILVNGFLFKNTDSYYQVTYMKENQIKTIKPLMNTHFYTCAIGVATAWADISIIILQQKYSKKESFLPIHKVEYENDVHYLWTAKQRTHKVLIKTLEERFRSVIVTIAASGTGWES